MNRSFLLLQGVLPRIMEGIQPKPYFRPENTFAYSYAMHAKSPSRSRTLLPGFLAGFLIYSLGLLLDRVFQHAGLNSRTITIDDLLIALLVGLLVLFYEERRRRALIQRLRTIELMNHHVRNSLQVIAFATPQQEELANKVRDAVERIEWALREVLPGQREDITELSFLPYSKESEQKSKTVA